MTTDTHDSGRNLIPNRCQRFDPALRRWAKYDTSTGERINVKADGSPYKRVAFAEPKRRFQIRLGEKKAVRRRAEMIGDAMSSRYLAGARYSADMPVWKKVRGAERNSVAVFPDGFRVYFDHKGLPLKHAM